MSRRTRSGFSLVEVVLALGVLTFALLVVTALLPIGLKSNQISVEESQAANLLTVLEADLRNTHPSANAGKSQLFDLALPYKVVSGQEKINDALTLNTISTVNSVAIKEDGTPRVAADAVPAIYQATVVYTSLPATSSAAPVQARLVISWPPATMTAVAQLTKGRGYLETFVTFPTP